MTPQEAVMLTLLSPMIGFLGTLGFFTAIILLKWIVGDPEDYE